jgi:outer membrane lipoprotein carrier protein
MFEYICQNCDPECEAIAAAGGTRARPLKMSGMRLFAPVALAALVTLPAAGQAPPSAADLAARLQARYETVRDFTARFTQSYESGLLKVPGTEPEQGEIKLKKPNRFRMTYRTPERKEFIADGKTIKSYFPADSVGSEHPMPEPGEASTALMFIAGRGNIARDFTAAFAPTQPDGEWHLILTPKTPQADFVTLTVVVNRRNLQLTGFGWTEDSGGRSLITLTNLRENTNVGDAEFAFQFPRGTIIERQ